jgi:hypothetical protein
VDDRDVLALQNTDTLKTVRYTPLRDRLATLLPGWAVEIQVYTIENRGIRELID